jgi:hypothetical protein
MMFCASLFQINESTDTATRLEQLLLSSGHLDGLDHKDLWLGVGLDELRILGTVLVFVVQNDAWLLPHTTNAKQALEFCICHDPPNVVSLAFILPLDKVNKISGHRREGKKEGFVSLLTRTTTRHFRSFYGHWPGGISNETDLDRRRGVRSDDRSVAETRFVISKQSNHWVIFIRLEVHHAREIVLEVEFRLNANHISMHGLVFILFEVRDLFHFSGGSFSFLIRFLSFFFPFLFPLFFLLSKK